MNKIRRPLDSLNFFLINAILCAGRLVGGGGGGDDNEDDDDSKNSDSDGESDDSSQCLNHATLRSRPSRPQSRRLNSHQRLSSLSLFTSSGAWRYVERVYQQVVEETFTITNYRVNLKRTIGFSVTRETSSIFMPP